MKKVIKSLFALAVMTAFTMGSTGCKKYEEGPTISFIPKKERISNDWRFDKVMNNGVDYTSMYKDFIYKMKNDGTYELVSGSTTYEKGTWELVSNKEKIRKKADKSSTYSEVKILKLKEKEMWLLDDDTEIHLKED